MEEEHKTRMFEGDMHPYNEDEGTHRYYYYCDCDLRCCGGACEGSFIGDGHTSEMKWPNVPRGGNGTLNPEGRNPAQKKNKITN